MTNITSRIILIGGIVFTLFCYWLYSSDLDLTWTHRKNFQLPYGSKIYIIKNEFESNSTSNNGTIKTILLWNRFFSIKHFGFGIGRKPFVDGHCPVTNCEISDYTDGSLSIPVEDYDAILFHMGDSNIQYPPKRKSHQRYVFFILESPPNFELSYKRNSTPKNYFNWTMTYSRESDIYYPYGWIHNITDQSEFRVPNPNVPKWLEPNFSNVINNTIIDKIIRKKNKLVAWFVSNCNTQSKRLQYVEELSKYISIDIYGYCGPLKCSRVNSNECDKMLDSNYKFYLSFENSLCEDYVTEKFFRAMMRNVVPVVYGGCDYKKIAPPMSYINAVDFKTHKELADYLKYLHKHPEEYKKYFWWKSWYRVLDTNTYIPCLLCQMLNNSTLPIKIYEDVNYWWTENKCVSP